MNNYWLEHFNSTAKLYQDSPLRQVDRIVKGEEVSEEQVRLLVLGIITALRLEKSDCLIDLCCGNGVITARLAPSAGYILGVDFAGDQIAAACRREHVNHIQYMQADVLDLDDSLFGHTKVLMQEALQYFSIWQFIRLLFRLRHLDSGCPAYFAGIPDRRKLKVYYDTPDRYAYYQNCERANQPHIGHWWHPWILHLLGNALGFRVTIMAQVPELYSAYYRFDALLERR